MRVYLFSESILKLQAIYDSMNLDNALLQEKIIHAYTQQTLIKLYDLFKDSTDQSRLDQRLEEFFQDNWAFIKGSSLCYTTLFNSDLTHLLIDIAQSVVNNKNSHLSSKDKPFCIIQILFPDLKTESIHNDFPDLEPYFDVQREVWVHPDICTILKTHILSSDGLHLLPIGLLLELKDSDQQLANPYYDYRTDSAENAFLNADEMSRLREHSSSTQALMAAIRHLDVVKADKSHLLGHLQLLITCLRYNGTNGIGREYDAGKGAYPAIINFIDYYHTIDEVEQPQVPADLKAEVERLIEMVSNPEKNKNATEQVETCVNIRRFRLQENMAGNERLLSALAVTGESKQKVLEQAQKDDEFSRSDLKKNLVNNQYYGRDNLPISLKLIKTLKVNSTISTQRDLDLLLTLSARELAEIISSREIRKQIVNCLFTLEELALFFIETKPDQLEVILPALAGAFRLKFRAEILKVLMLLDAERFLIVIKVLKNEFFRPGSAEKFDSLLRNLNTEQRLVVCSLFTDDELLRLIESPINLLDVLRYLPPARWTALCEKCLESYTQFYVNFPQIYPAFKAFDKQQCFIIYTVFKTDIVPLINSLDDFNYLVEHMAPDVQKELYIECRYKLLLFADRGTLIRLLGHLAPEQCREVCQLYQQYHPDGFSSLSDLLTMRRELDSEKFIIFCQTYSLLLIKFIRSPTDLAKFRLLAENLSLYQLIKCAQMEKFDSLLREFDKNIRVKWADAEFFPEEEVAKKLSASLKKSKINYLHDQNYGLFKRNCEVALMEAGVLDSNGSMLTMDVSSIVLFLEIPAPAYFSSDTLGGRLFGNKQIGENIEQLYRLIEQISCIDQYDISYSSKPFDA